MHCRETLALLDRAAEEGLDLRQAASLDEHVAGCEACREAHERLLAFHAILDGDPDPEPPPGFRERVMARVLAERRTREGFFPRAVQLAFAVLSVALMGWAALALRPMNLGAFVSRVHLRYTDQLREVVRSVSGAVEAPLGGLAPLLAGSAVVLFLLLATVAALRANGGDRGGLHGR